MDYKLIYDRDSFVARMQNRGYDLTDPSVLDCSHFQVQEEAIDDFLQIAFDKIYELIKEYRGKLWTKAFMADMQHDDLTGDALEYQEILKDAIVEQAVFIWDNGDKEASSNQDDRLVYSPIAVKKLWGTIIRG